MIPVLLDVDTGVDDALALAMAVMLDELSLIAVTTVAGNVDVQRATSNTRRVLDWLGAIAVPVARGAAQPLLRPHRDARAVHGEDGLGGAHLPVVRSGPVIDASAPEIIVRTARRYRGALRLVCLGPLTNLAIAVRLEPQLPEYVERLIVMGGAFTVPGNVTPTSEFNVWSDPEAASIVAGAGFRMIWVGLDVTREVRLEREHRDGLVGLETPAAKLLIETTRWWLDRPNTDHFILHDPLALAVAAQPELVDGPRARVIVDTRSGPTLGRTDYTMEEGGASVVARSVNRDRFFALFWRAFAPERCCEHGDRACDPS
ncbi:nucleoside hydrolase [Thermomicrobium sp. 4228-Ro]|uniref:nucleoside hydrolase n=1 Tax=Thermomicrobium sp. 4228-Ro TaxID=2993937 RepID=UPI0022490195|nr:nucleoside hydrolase [Thermomicrobium sp. 4228-Ro]MCX2727697.1 nucleoside hydrolase [Thermomicrobium sp. 4228-Ro]